jgi:pimeloyl-ACP methyl ester carboxylesterase
MPRSAAGAVDDLHALLRAADLPPPYVLVGHSTGGLIVRLYASTFPDEVVGMVLVDAISEAMQRLLTPEQFAIYDQKVLVDAPPAIASYVDLEIIDFPAPLGRNANADSDAAADAAGGAVEDEPFPLPPGCPRKFPAVVEAAWTEGNAGWRCWCPTHAM